MLKLETTILSGMINGENDAFEECYKLFSPVIYSSIVSVCRDESIANDLLQDTFVDAFKSIATFNVKESFLPWIKKIGFNNTLNYIKKIKRQNATLCELKGFKIAHFDSFDEVDNQDLLDKLLSKISETERMVLWLSIVEQYNHEEIGQLFNKTASFSKSTLSRTLKKLKGKPEVKKYAG